MKTSKKLLSLFLAALMIFGLLPTMAFATGTECNGESCTHVAAIGTTHYDTLADAVQAAAEGQTIEIIKTAEDGYKVPNISQNITIKGADSLKDANGVPTVVFDCKGSGNIASIPNGATFENVAMNFGTGNYHGFQHAGTINMKNCTLNGLFFSYGDMNFTGCTFNAPGTAASGVESKDYSMWCYGEDCTYTNCIFNGAGKFLNVYNEGNDGGTPWNITATGCTFNSSVVNKAAFNVKETCGTTELRYNVSISDCTCNENFPAVKEDGRLLVIDPLVQVDDKNTGDTAMTGITVTLNGNTVYKDGKAVPKPVVVIETGEEDKNAEVTIEQNSDVVTEGESVAEEIKALDNEIKTAIANNTKVTDVNLTTTAEEGKTSGLQAVVDTAIKENTALAEAIKNAEVVNVEVKVSVIPTEFKAPVEATQETPEQVGTVTFELKPTAIVTVGTGDDAKSQKVDVDNDMIDQSKPITVSFYTGFEPAKIVHTGDDGFEEVFRPTGDKTFSYNNGVCTLKIIHFSKLTALSEDYAAQVTIGENTTNYKTLADAISAANKAGADSWDKAPVIELLDNCEVHATHQPDNYGAVHFYANWGDVKDAYFILNGNNHTIKLTGEDPTTNKKGRFLTLKFSAGTHGKVNDLIVDANQKGHAAVDCVNSEVYLDNVTVKNTDGGWSAFNIVNSTVELKNCTATENVKQVISCDKGTKDAPSIATIKSGTYDGTLRTEGTNEYNKLIIEGGKFSFASVNQNDGKQDMIIDEAEGSIIEISGGIFSIAPTANVLAEDLKVVDNTDEDTKTTYPYTVGPMEPVAKIGEKTYTTLAEAVTAAQNGDTIKLLDNTELTANVIIDKNITLDLAGKTVECGTNFLNISQNVTITGNGTINKNGTENTESVQYPGVTTATATFKGSIYVAPQASLTIKNGTYTTKSSSLFVCNNGTLTMEDGLFKCTSNATYDTKGLIDVRGENGVLKLLGGSVKCYENWADYEGMYGVTPWDGATLILGAPGTDGPTIHSYYAAICTNGSTAPAIINVYSGTYISDCDVTSDLDAEADMNVILISADAKAGTEVNIYGGTFTQTAKNATTSHVIEVRWKAEKNINIVGGKFSSNAAVIHSGTDNINTALSISGGYYTSDVSAYVANGYVCIDNNDEATNKDYPYIVTVAPTKVEVTNEATTVVKSGDKADTINSKISDTLAGEVKKDVVEKIVENASKTSTSNIQEQITEEKVQVKDSDETKEVTLDESSKTRIDVKLESVQINVGTTEATPTLVTECTVTTKTATYDVKPVVTITTTNETTGETTVETFVITNGWLTENNKVLTFTLPVPGTMTGDSVLVTHTKENGEAETFNARVETDASGNRYITIVATEFSTYELSQQTEEGAAAKIENGGKTYYYNSLANAISDAQNGDTIVLLQNSETGTITVSREVSFTLNLNEKTLNATIAAGEGYEISKNNDTYTVSKPSQTAPAEGEGYTVDRENGKIIPKPGYEIRGGIGKFDTKELPLRFDVPYFVRKAGTDKLNPSPETEFTISEIVCEYTKTVKLAEGTYSLKLNGINKGEFTFTKNGSGWNIKNAENKYLAMKDGKLALSDTAFAWTYKNGAFSTSVKTTQKSSGTWFLFWYIPGGNKTVTTTYYLSTVTNDDKLSTKSVCAELYTTVSGEHDFGCWIDCKDGNHKHICKNCGEVETDVHHYGADDKCAQCGAFDSTKANVKISVVDVKTKTTKQFSGFLFWGTWKNVTTYTATIKTEATGVKVTKVQYQLNGGRWTTGTCVSSDKPIETLKVKAWDSNGNVHEYTYSNN